MTDTAGTDRTGSEFDFQGFAAVLQRRRAVLALIVVTLTGVAVLRSVTASPSYSSTAEVVVRAPTTPQFLDDSNTGGDRDVVATEVRIMGSASVLDAAADTLGHQPDVTIRSRDESEVVEILGRAPTAKDAARDANVVAETYVHFREERTVAQLSSALEELQRQYDAAQTALDKALAPVDQLRAAVAVARTQSDRSVLQAELDSLEAGVAPRRQALLSQMAAVSAQRDELQLAQAVAATSSAEVISPAEPPGGPSSPKPIRDGAVALVTALILGVGAALLADRLDDSLRDVEQVERVSGLPVLGVVPAMTPIVRPATPLPATLARPGGAFAEAFRTLRTALRFFDLDGAHPTLLVTSPTVGDGKTTTVANLGVALAWTGRTVVMVSCDLRRGDLPQKFGIERSVGLTSILLGEAGIEGSLVPVGEVPGLAVLPPGPLPPNPAEILGSERMSAVLAELGKQFDHVLLDCPPVVAVSDALALCASSNAPVLLVVRAGGTSTRMLRRCLDLLRQLNPHLLGAVLNRSDLPEVQDGAYNYARTERDVDEGSGVAIDPRRAPSPASMSPTRTQNG